MFVVGAIVILIVSFVIAFFSLIRERRKLKKEFEGYPPEAQLKAEPMSALQPKATAEPSFKQEPVSEPFPWEVSKSSSVAPPVVAEENYILHPKRPSGGVGTTVSLKDLADKNRS